MDATLNWQAVGVLAGLVTTYCGLMLWAVKAMMAGMEKRIDERFDTLKAERRKEAEHVAKIERDLLELKAELPREYVLREDWIRFGAGIDAKIDRVHAAVDAVRQEIHERR